MLIHSGGVLRFSPARFISLSFLSLALSSFPLLLPISLSTFHSLSLSFAYCILNDYKAYRFLLATFYSQPLVVSVHSFAIDIVAADLPITTDTTPEIIPGIIIPTTSP